MEFENAYSYHKTPPYLGIFLNVCNTNYTHTKRLHLTFLGYGEPIRRALSNATSRVGVRLPRSLRTWL